MSIVHKEKKKRIVVSEKSQKNIHKIRTCNM